MKKALISQLVSILLTQLTPNMLKSFADKVLDFAEDYAVSTKGKYDDIVILPLCKAIRNAFDIPDND